MRRKFRIGALCLSAFSASIFATTSVDTTIYKIVSPTSMEENFKIYSFHEGRILRVSAHDSAWIEKLEEARSNKQFVRFSLGDDSKTVEDVEILTEKIDYQRIEEVGPQKFDGQGFHPTNISSYGLVEELFDSLPEGDGESSQCFQRAHAWSYQMWREHGIKSNKVFVFFSDNYIANWNYDWWFHVAPYVVHSGKEVVLDKTFTDSPLSMKDWKDIFVYSHESCPTIKRYSEYENSRGDEDCYLFKSPMYYFQPLDLEAVEEEGQVKTSWVEWEVEAGKSAFYYKSRRESAGGLFRRIFGR